MVSQFPNHCKYILALSSRRLLYYDEVCSEEKTWTRLMLFLYGTCNYKTIQERTELNNLIRH